MPTDPEHNPQSQEVEAVTALYTIERSMGFSVQANLLTVWIAATTYLISALGILTLLLGSEIGKGLGETTRAILISALAFPACALAGYHLILFGIGLIHSRSIDFLEKELIGIASAAIKTKYASSGLGSKSETAWTNFDAKRIGMALTSGVAFLVPYLSAVLLATLSILFAFQFAVVVASIALAIYLVILAVLLGFGAKTLREQMA